ncbi:MAG: polyphosphate:nucleotide phosphotransferase, family [Gemmatimonadetes bacterium]|nr:polyphosphate:nucleotide phosphotransferase, family [Gemmatimonadota bacterium]
MKLAPVRGKDSIHLGDSAASVSLHHDGSDALAEKTAKYTDRIGELQRVLYADGRFALLVVLQGRDASGKDGTVRKVFCAVNPQGCVVTSFKAPTELEKQHDFLWRVHVQVPPRGMIGVFNRSHYEDVLVPRVHKLIKKSDASARYAHINAFEEMLAANGVVILKFMLHVSRDEQKVRLQERLSDETKNWKFRADDLDDRKRWDAYTKAYRGVLEHTSTAHAPWYIVPADDKPTRDLLIARTIADAMEDMTLRYPPADPAVLALEIT